MRKQDIEIRISPTGEVSFTVKGIKGASCFDETKFLEEALGGGVLAQERTGEYYEQSEGAGASAWATSGEESDD
ncbi:MAG TPA: DUF2997 domain-containing protein [Kofleriaceae bacterium]|nr:DUF2997 domain-containing protein [Kofleriaceae bacterium]